MFSQLKKGCYDLIAKMALRSPLHRKLVRKQVEGTRAHLALSLAQRARSAMRCHAAMRLHFFTVPEFSALPGPDHYLRVVVIAFVARTFLSPVCVLLPLTASPSYQVKH